jgi:hypothetical protein
VKKLREVEVSSVSCADEKVGHGRRQRARHAATLILGQTLTERAHRGARSGESLPRGLETAQDPEARRKGVAESHDPKAKQRSHQVRKAAFDRRPWVEHGFDSLSLRVILARARISCRSPPRSAAKSPCYRACMTFALAVLMQPRFLFPLWAALACACAAPEYSYVPKTSVTTSAAGQVSGDYGVPPDRPTGTMRVASYGVVEIAPKGSPAQALHALHLRAVIMNGSDGEWLFDVREQRLDLDGRGKSAPALVSVNAGQLPPDVVIPPSSKRVVDLFFPLPDDLQDAAELPSFDAIWCLNTGHETVVRRTAFERLRVEPAALRDYDYGPDLWAPPYWFNPGYAQYTFTGASPVPQALTVQPLSVRHKPETRFTARSRSQSDVGEAVGGSRGAERTRGVEAAPAKGGEVRHR